MKNAKGLLKYFALSPNLSFVENSELALTFVLGKVYDVHVSEPLYSPHLSTSKLLKNLDPSYLVQVEW